MQQQGQDRLRKISTSKAVNDYIVQRNTGGHILDHQCAFAHYKCQLEKPTRNLLLCTNDMTG